MSPTRIGSVADVLLTVDEISARTGHSPKSIRQLRSRGHELYSRARRAGNRLVLEESVVGEWIEHHRAATTKRLVAKRIKDSGSLDESLERLVGGDERMRLGAGIDRIRHHSWCMEACCRGCLDAGW